MGTAGTYHTVDDDIQVASSFCEKMSSKSTMLTSVSSVLSHPLSVVIFRCHIQNNSDLLMPKQLSEM